MKKFNHLNVPDQWNNYFTRYPQGYTILESLLNWVTQVDNMVDNQNALNKTVADYRVELDDFIDRFDPRLQEEVTKTLSEWQDSGFLDVVIDEALQTQMDVLEQETQDKLNAFRSELAQITHLVTSYGAIGDGETDDTLAISQAISETSLTDGELKFPKGYVFKTTQEIVIPTNINVIMESPIMYHGLEEITPLVVGDKNENIKGKHYKLWVEKPYRNWDNASVGCKIYNSDDSIIHLHRVAEFTTGVQFIGSSGGFAYNEIYVGHVYNCKYPLHLTSENNGWCNENQFYGGRFSNASVNQSGARYGVRIGSLDGTYKRFNNNVFHKPSFELFTDPVGETVPILIEEGLQNYFYACRNEANGNEVFARVLVGNNNHFEIGYEDSDSESYIEAPNSTNTFIKPVAQFLDENKLQKDTLMNEGVIGLRSTVDVAEVTLPKNIFGWQYNENNKRSIIRESAIIGDAIKLNSIAYGVGVSIKNNSNRLHISPRFVSGKEGRMVLRPLDSAGNLILGITSFEIATAPYMYETLSVQYRETYFKGCYMTYGESGLNTEIILDNSIDTLEIMFVGGSSSPAEIEGFSVSDVYNPFRVSFKKSYALPFG